MDGRPDASSAEYRPTRPLPASVRGSDGRYAVLMGQPTYFASISNRSPSPADLRPSAYRGKPNRDVALMQWQGLARAIHKLGIDIFVAPADKKCPEIAYAGSAGLITDHSANVAVADKKFIRATPADGNMKAALHFERIVRGLGVEIHNFDEPFAGEADFVKCGDQYLFTWGDTEPGRGLLGKKAPAFGSDRSLREPLSSAVGNKRVFEMQLIDPRFPRADFCACPVGPGRRILMVYVEALNDDARRVILAGKSKVADFIIPISHEDAAMYAANSFQITDKRGRHHLLMPDGVSSDLVGRVESAGIRPVLIELSEWIKRDRGGVKALLCDLGWMCDDRRTHLPEITDFRKSIRYRPG